MVLNIHGANEEYWRDDNPFIQAWYRFGDNPPVNNFNGKGDFPEDHFSGCMVDSSMYRRHLAFRGSDVATIMLPVSGIAPSGTTHTSISGLQLGGVASSTWIDAAHPHVLFAHHMNGTSANQRENAPMSDDTTNATGRGKFSFGTDSQNSGFMIAGWLQVPAGAGSPTASRPLWGDGRMDLATIGTDSHWLIHYVPQDDSGSSDVLRLVLRHNNALTGGTGTDGTSPFYNGSTLTSTIDNAGTPWNIPLDEPFFFAYTVHRELDHETQNPDPFRQGNAAGFGGIGSGLATMYLGTETSGLFKVAEHRFEGTVDVRGPASVTEIYALGNRESAVRAAVNVQGMPENTIMDEFVFVHDGYMGFDRIEYLMNSGIEPFPAQDPNRREFEPQLPGIDKLQAYFSFDLADSPEEAAQNSAPDTSGIFQGIYGTQCRPTDGIRGGSGMRMLASPNLLRNASLTPAILPQFFSVPIGSGFNHMWPDIKRTGQQTWIGWIRPGRLNNSLWMPVVGWRAGANRNQAWGKNNWVTGGPSTGGPHFSNGEYNLNEGGWQFNVSGGLVATESIISADGGNNTGFNDSEWQLWACCIDFTNGILYHVKDAKHVVLDSLKMSSESGWDPTELFNNSSFGVGDRATHGAAWMFSRANSLTETTEMRVDDWAIYDRILTLPEMSGYALSGIAEEPVTSPIDTSLKRTLGYWKMDQASEELFDPTGASGIRYSDSSWYRHHFTNVSGSFSINTDEMNSRIGSESLQVNISGSMLSVRAQDHGANLDFSSRLIFESSGFMCGSWMFLPSGDIETQGNGSSGLFGDHHVMGAWGQAAGDRSWQLGIRDNKPYFAITPSGSSTSELVAVAEAPFEQEFFLFAQVFPSGGSMAAEIYLGTDPTTTDVTLIGQDEALVGGIVSNLENVGPSGFSLLNVPNRDQGFPSGTRIQGPFVYAGSFNTLVGSLETLNIGQIKRASVTDTPLLSGAVSIADPANVSHWRFDQAGAQVVDYGREQNFLRLINTDAHQMAINPAFHGSGVLVRQTEYLDTLPNNEQTRRLDLGSGNTSWTVLSWVVPPVTPATDVPNVIAAKSAATSGVQIFTPQNSQTLSANASGKTTVAQNGDLAPGQLNHIAVVFDRDNAEFTTIVNGRYAGSAFDELVEVPVNSSGFAVGGRGDSELNALFGGPGFSGQIDDMLVFERALSLPEISGLAANTYSYAESLGNLEGFFGGYMSGQAQFIISGLIGAFMHGQAQDLELFGGFISGVSGSCEPYGGFIHGRALASGLMGGFMHGIDTASGVFGHFIHGVDTISGFIGHYMFGARESLDEFDCTLNFRIVNAKDFDARLGVEKTQFIDFDALLGVIHITPPPGCTLELPLVGTIVSGLPFVLTVQGSGFAFEDKTIEMVRFTFADFKDAEVGTLVQGLPNSGLFEATREYDTSGLFNVKIEVLDSFGYRSSCVQPFMIIPSGVESGVYLNSLPGIKLNVDTKTGSAIQRVEFQHIISGLNTTSGLLEYTDFADQQESLVPSLEMPSGTQFMAGTRSHDYTMPGFYAPVWAVSGSWGIVSDTIADGIDFLG